MGHGPEVDHGTVFIGPQSLSTGIPRQLGIPGLSRKQHQQSPIMSLC